MREITMAKAINEALLFCMQEDKNVIILGEDVAGGVFPPVEGLAERFGKNRVINTPLCEAGFTGMAVGAAVTGLRPVVEIMFMDFMTIPMDMIANHAAKQLYNSGGQNNCSIVFRTAAGGGRGGGSLHSQYIPAWFMHMPGLKVVVPSTPYDAKGLMIASIHDNNPVVFIEPRMLYATKGHVPEESYEIPLGEAEIKKEGKDVTLVTNGRMVQVAIEAAKILSGQGIEIEIIDPRTLKPLDEETIIESVKKTGRLATLDEGYERCGVGSEIVAVVMRNLNSLKAPVQTIAAPNSPVPVSPALEKIYYPSAAVVAKKISQMMKV